MNLKSQNTRTSPKSLSKPYFFSPIHSLKSTFFQPKLSIDPVDDRYEREADRVAERRIQRSSDMDFGNNGDVESKCAECKQDEVKMNRDHRFQQPFFNPAIAPIQKMYGQMILQKSTDEDPATKPPSKLPSFEIKSSEASKKDIRETLRDEGNSFSFGWITDPGIFSWEAEVAIHGNEEVQSGSWVVGMLQLMKDYHLNIRWGDQSSPKKCGDNFPEANVRDVKNSMGGSPWFDDLTTTGAFQLDGEAKSTKIVDSPGGLNIPYQHSDTDFSSNFGNFDFGCSFISYLSAFNYNDPLSTEAWKHLKSINWSTSLKGSFDARRELSEKLTVIGGGTTIGGVTNGYPAGLPPKLVGLAAIDKICPISQCWNPKLKCTKVWIP